MGTVDDYITCPVCGAVRKCLQSYNYRTDRAFYHCESCGYSTDTDVADHTETLKDSVPEDLMPFVKWVVMEPGKGTVLIGRVPWWPAGTEMMGAFTIAPIGVQGELKWRRHNIEPIPQHEQHMYPREEGGGCYVFRASEVSAEYDRFEKAFRATSTANHARGLAQVAKTAPEFELLTTTDGRMSSVDEKKNARLKCEIKPAEESECDENA